MKGVKFSVLFFLPILILFNLILFSPQTKVEAYQYVRVEGRQLMTDFDENGIYRPYTIQGVSYSPDPIGRHPSDWGYADPEDPRPDNVFDDPEILERDFTLLQAMNANAIRLWSTENIQSGTRFPTHLTLRTLDYAEEHNLKIIPGFWIPNEGYWQCDGSDCSFIRTTDYENQDVRNNLLSRFGNYVSYFKYHPGLLFWAIGNENNFHFSDNPQKISAFYSLVNEMAQLAHQIEGDDYHPVAFVNGDLGYIGDPTYGTTDAQMNNLDIWGSNVYHGDSFDTFFEDYAALSAKPLWISEYGIDAYHTTDANNPSVGYEDQATQASWDGKLWDEIVANSDTTIGGTIMAYSDMWWKPYEWLCIDTGDDCNVLNSTQNYFGFGPTDISNPPDGILNWIPPSPDNFFHEEWWGIVSIAPHPTDPYGPDVMTPRQVYTTLQNKFSPIIPPVIDPIGDKTALLGRTLQFTVTASDPQDEPIILMAKLASGDPLSSIGAEFTDNGDGTGTFEWNPVGVYGDIIPVTFKAFDPNDFIDVETISLQLGQHRIVSPAPGNTLTDPTVVFTLEGSPNVTNFWLGVGTTADALRSGGDIYYQSVGLNTTVSVPGVFLTGEPIYVRLWSIAGSSWKYTDYVYQTIDLGGVPATMSTPTPKSMLTNSTVTFNWDAGTAVTEYRLGVGTNRTSVETGGDIYYQSVGTDTSVSVPEIPMNGDNIYVRLWSKISGTWFFIDYTYGTENQTPIEFDIVTPVPGSAITTTSVRFTWSGNGISRYRLALGTTVGAEDIWLGYFYWSNGFTVKDIPLTGDPIYVRLYALTINGWQHKDYTYQTTLTSTPAVMTSPTPGATLSTGSATFSWNTGIGVSEYRLGVGTTQSSVTTGGNIYYQSLGTNTSANVSGIPLVGQTIYVRLWSRIGSDWQYNDYTYQTVNELVEPEITTPTPGSTLPSSTVTFQWNPGDGVTNYWLGVGTSMDAIKRGGDIYYQSVGSTTSMTVSGIPLTGDPIYVRLWWIGPAGFKRADYVFQTQ